jgi:hypothetical protein
MSLVSKSLNASIWSRVTVLKLLWEPAYLAESPSLGYLIREGFTNLTRLDVLSLPPIGDEHPNLWPNIVLLLVNQPNMRVLKLVPAPPPGVVRKVSSGASWSNSLQSFEVNIGSADAVVDLGDCLPRATSLQKLSVSASFWYENDELDRIRLAAQRLPNLVSFSDGAVPPQDPSIYRGFTSLRRMWLPQTIDDLGEEHNRLIRDLSEAQTSGEIQSAVARYFTYFRQIFPENIPARISWVLDPFSNQALHASKHWVDEYISAVLQHDRNRFSGAIPLCRIGIMSPKSFEKVVKLIDRSNMDSLLGFITKIGVFLPKSGDPASKIQHILAPLIEPAISQLRTVAGVDRCVAAVSIFGPRLLEEVVSSAGVQALKPFLAPEAFHLYGVRVRGES